MLAKERIYIHDWWLSPGGQLMIVIVFGLIIFVQNFKCEGQAKKNIV